MKARGAITRRIAVHFWPAFDRHLAGDLLDEEVELRRARPGVGAEDRGVEAVGLHREADGVLDHRRMAAQLAPGPGGAGEGHDVLAGDVVEQVAHRARR